jgi:hypothetical protein
MHSNNKVVVTMFAYNTIIGANVPILMTTVATTRASTLIPYSKTTTILVK